MIRMRSYPAILVRPHSPSAEWSDLVAAALDGLGVVALEEAGRDGAVRAFFHDPASRSHALRALRAAFSGAHIEALDVPDENWAERSQASLRAIRAGALTVAPPWDVPSNARDVIVILPSMGFGTGHHATTRLCLIALQDATVGGTSVLDVGTGSGVLALAAAKLGASRVLGIDNDPDAIANAVENQALNGLDVEFRCAGIEDAAADGPFDLLVANLTGGVLIRHAGRLEALTREGGFLILSGLRDEEESDVTRAFGAECESREGEEGWVCLVLRRQPEGCATAERER